MVDIQNLLSELLVDFENSNQVKAQVGELLNSVTLFNMLFGFDSILQNSQSFNSTLGETSLNILNEIVNSAQQSTQLSLSNFEQFYLKSILDALYSYIVKTSMSDIALVDISRKLGSVLLRSILIGQSPIKFETQFHLNYLNKHFKNELNSMRLTSDIVNITLPSRISTLLTTSSIKTPISYDWFIEKDGQSYSLPQGSWKFFCSSSSIIHDSTRE